MPSDSTKLEESSDTKTMSDDSNSDESCDTKKMTDGSDLEESSDTKKMIDGSDLEKLLDTKKNSEGSDVEKSLDTKQSLNGSAAEDSYWWINDKLIQNLLNTLHNGRIFRQIIYTIKQVIRKGQNHIGISDAIQLDINYSSSEFEKHEDNFIVKYENQHLKFFSPGYSVIDEEQKIFEIVLPKIDELLSSVELREQIGPRFYGSGPVPRFIIVEDLKSKDYKYTDIANGLDYKHLKCVLRKMAKYHAATAFIGTQPKNILDEYISDTTEAFHPLETIIKNILLACAEVCKNWNDYETVYEKLIKNNDIFLKKFFEARTRNDNEFNVLCHGYLRTTNVMFKTNVTGELEDSLLVDFEFNFWGSPALDVCFFLYMCSSMSVLPDNWTQLIDEYYETLKTTLIKLNYSKPIPSLNELQTQIVNRGIYAVPFTIVSLGTRDIETDIGFGLKEEDRNVLVAQLSRQDFKEELERYLNFYNKIGYFDEEEYLKDTKSIPVENGFND